MARHSRQFLPSERRCDGRRGREVRGDDWTAKEGFRARSPEERSHNSHWSAVARSRRGTRSYRCRAATQHWEEACRHRPHRSRKRACRHRPCSTRARARVRSRVMPRLPHLSRHPAHPRCYRWHRSPPPRRRCPRRQYRSFRSRRRRSPRRCPRSGASRWSCPRCRPVRCYRAAPPTQHA